MGEHGYHTSGYGAEYIIYFSESDDDWGCLCTFPHNDHGELTSDRVRSLALLGAAVVLASHQADRLESAGRMAGPHLLPAEWETLILPQVVPQWIRDEIQRIVPVEEER